MDKARIVLIGAGNRGTGAYLPTIAALKAEIELVAVCDQDSEKAAKAAEQYNVPHYSDIAEMLEKEKPDVAAIVITPSSNHVAGNITAEHGVSYVTETPIATSLADADSMMATARKNNVKIEVAENYYRAPNERIKGELIKAGVFGKILTAYNDFRGHGYHGVSLIRSYVGFDNDAKRVVGFEQRFEVQMHQFRQGQPMRNDEAWRHGVFEFEDGARGIFNFTSLSYGSPMRWRNSTKFYGERGMAVGDELAILDDDAASKRVIHVERKTAEIEGVVVLQALEADTDPKVVWENPLRNHPLNDGQISVASEIVSIVAAVREDKAPEYGALNGRKDRELDLAMSASHANGNVPVELPLTADQTN